MIDTRKELVPSTPVLTDYSVDYWPIAASACVFRKDNTYKKIAGNKRNQIPEGSNSASSGFRSQSYYLGGCPEAACLETG